MENLVVSYKTENAKNGLKNRIPEIWAQPNPHLRFLKNRFFLIREFRPVPL